MAFRLGPRMLPESGQRRKQIWRESRQASERKTDAWVVPQVGRCGNGLSKLFLFQVKKSDSKTFETLGEQQIKQNQNGNKNEGKLI